MASSAKTAAIRYADKVVFVLALGLLGYVAATSFVAKETSESDKKLENIGGLQDQVNRYITVSKPKPESVPVLTGKLRDRWVKAPTAADFRPWIFNRPRPITYPLVTLRVDDTREIKFREPLVTTRRTGELTAVTVDEGPNKSVFVIKGAEEGKVKLAGEDSRGITHEVPIVVLAKKELIEVVPPEQLTAEATLGKIALSWQVPKVQPAGVLKAESCVYRRHESEKEAKLLHVTSESAWDDTDIESGEIYFYYTSIKGSTDDAPIESEPSGTIQVTAKSMVEFHLETAAEDRALLVVRRFSKNQWLTGKFAVWPGGLIGGEVRSRGELVDFATGSTLVDILLNAPRVEVKKRPVKVFDDAGRFTGWGEKVSENIVPTNKVIYQDRKGIARVLWQGAPDKGKTVAPKPEATIKPEKPEPTKPAQKPSIFRPVD